jgi:hypothetical protein
MNNIFWMIFGSLKKSRLKLKIPRIKWKWKHNLLYTFGFSKGNCTWAVCSYICLHLKKEKCGPVVVALRACYCSYLESDIKMLMVWDQPSSQQISQVVVTKACFPSYFGKLDWRMKSEVILDKKILRDISNK